MGGSVGVWPLDLKKYTAADISTAPYVEYDVPVVSGVNTIDVRCLPSHPLYSPFGMSYGLSIDGGATTIVDIDASSGTEPGGAKYNEWAGNVERGFTTRKSTYSSSAAKNIKVRIYFADPGLVISGIAVSHAVSVTGSVPETREKILIISDE
jgi:hypothetical protein